MSGFAVGNGAALCRWHDSRSAGLPEEEAVSQWVAVVDDERRVPGNKRRAGDARRHRGVITERGLRFDTTEEVLARDPCIDDLLPDREPATRVELRKDRARTRAARRP